MKVCPQCGGQFPDSYILCKEDGFPLLDGSSEMPVPSPELALVGDNEPTAVKPPPPVAVLAPQPSLAPLGDELSSTAEETSGDSDIYEYDDTTNKIDGDTDAEGFPTALAGQEFNLVPAEDLESPRRHRPSGQEFDLEPAAEDLESTRRHCPSGQEFDQVPAEDLESTRRQAPSVEIEPEDDSLEPERALPTPSAGRDLCPDEGPTEVVDHDEPTSINPAAAEAVAARMGRVPDPAEAPARLPPVQKPEVILQVREAETTAAPATSDEEPTTPAPVDEEPMTPAPVSEEPTTPAGFEAATDSVPTPIYNPVIEPAEEPTYLPVEEPPTPVEEPTPYIEPAAGPSPASIMELNPLAQAATQPVTNDTEPSPALHEQSAALGPARALAEAQARAQSAAVTPQMTQEVPYVYTEQPEAVVFGRRRRLLFVVGGIVVAAVIGAGIAVALSGGDEPDGAVATR
jgi:hypothetical protein